MPTLYRSAGQEPSLDEVFADPIIHAVMRRDGVSRETLCHVVKGARISLGLVPDGVVPLPAAIVRAETRCPERALWMRCG